MTNIDAQNILVDIVLFHNLNDAELEAIRMAEEALEEKFAEERLKNAMEAEPMGVMIVPYRENCFECDYCKHNLDGNYCGARGHVGGNAPRTGKPDWCPLHEAIGIIESNGHVKYLREEEE